MIRGRGPGQQDFSEWDSVDDEVGDKVPKIPGSDDISRLAVESGRNSRIGSHSRSMTGLSLQSSVHVPMSAIEKGVGRLKTAYRAALHVGSGAGRVRRAVGADGRFLPRTSLSSLHLLSSVAVL